jgi:hypothetical protein
MDERDIFNTQEEEIRRLGAELGEIKDVLRELARKATAIETRLRRAFPTALPKKPARTAGRARGASLEPTMTVSQVLAAFDEALALARSSGVEQARTRLDGWVLGDLNLLRAELGASLGKKKPSKVSVLEAIVGRLNESLLLTQHTNRRELIAANDPDPLPKELHEGRER